MNGILRALVSSITFCASVRIYDSLVVGAVGSLLANCTNVTVMKEWLKLEDPARAMGVHAMGGFWVCIAVALFGDSVLPGVNLIAYGLF